jgi:hypothetical protein
MEDVALWDLIGFERKRKDLEAFALSISSYLISFGEYHISHRLLCMPFNSVVSRFNANKGT